VSLRIAILDPYVRRSCRVSKDTNGGFGTANDYGQRWVARLLTRIKATSVDWPPLYSLYTAAALRGQGHEVSYSRDLDSLGAADLVLVTTSIVCHETELECIRQLKANGHRVGAIGSFVSSVPAPYLEAGAFVVAGEPEMFFLSEAWTGSALEDLEGVVRADQPTALDDVPPPAWDLVFQDRPPRYGLLGRTHQALPILATRGCPYSCFQYCTYPLQQGRKVLARSPDHIVAEMQQGQDRYGASLFLFRDPVFSIRRDHTMELCEALENSGRQFQFIIETHLKNLDDELIERLRRAGLVMVKTGVESADEEVLKASRRAFVDENTELGRIRLLEDQGVKVACFYMFGFPDDSLESCEATIRRACQLNTYGAQFSVFTPYPGTPAYQDYQDRLLTHRFEDFTQWHLVFRHDRLSPDQVRAILDRAYQAYYTRPRWMAKFMRGRLRRS
jgi:radical SAM superfamily enzyme YgiQ (UPF0313 family)